MKNPDTSIGDGGWQEELRNAVRDPLELAALLELPRDLILRALTAAEDFRLLVPRGYVARMTKGDPDDPLLLQVLPAASEAEAKAGFGSDPLDEQRLVDHGILRRYAGRALLITTGVCPVHCRYCFRREFPYADKALARGDVQAGLDALRHAAGVSEVVLSGGDPLSLGNAGLKRLIDGIEALPAVKTVRIHTRFPVVVPSRVDDGLIALLSETRLNTVVVIHANHPAEVDDAVRAAATKLKRTVDALLNQSVLLRNVNDDVRTLIALSERLLECGVLPYYLHQLDRVTGAGRFEVDDESAIRLIDEMRKQVAGYLVPRLVRDQAGEPNKTPLA